MSSSLLRNAIVLGLLAAVGPFAIDMYLPALPSIAADLGASTAAGQEMLQALAGGYTFAIATGAVIMAASIVIALVVIRGSKGQPQAMAH